MKRKFLGSLADLTLAIPLMMLAGFLFGPGAGRALAQEGHHPLHLSHGLSHDGQPQDQEGL